MVNSTIQYLKHVETCDMNSNYDPTCTTNLFFKSIENLRADFERLRVQSELVHHVLIESVTSKRANWILGITDSLIHLPRCGLGAHSDERFITQSSYSNGVDMTEFGRLNSQGTRLLEAVNTDWIMSRFGKVALLPKGWQHQWTMFVHVLGWLDIPDSLHIAARRTCINERMTCPFNDALAVKEGRLAYLPEQFDLSEVPNPPDWFSTVDDMLGASVAALDILTECGRESNSILKSQFPNDKIGIAAEKIKAHLVKNSKIPESDLAEILGIELPTLRDYMSKAKLSKRKAGQKGEVDLSREDLNSLRKFYEGKHPTARAHRILHKVLIKKAKSHILNSK